MATDVEFKIGPDWGAEMDYDSFASYAAAQAKNLVTADERHVLQPKGICGPLRLDSADGWVTDSTRYILVAPLEVDWWNGVRGSASAIAMARGSTTGDVNNLVNVPYTQVWHLQFTSDAPYNDAPSWDTVLWACGASIIFDSCCFDPSAFENASGCGVFTASDTIIAVFRNCAFFNGITSPNYPAFFTSDNGGPWAIATEHLNCCFYSNNANGSVPFGASHSYEGDRIQPESTVTLRNCVGIKSLPGALRSFAVSCPTLIEHNNATDERALVETSLTSPSDVYSITSANEFVTTATALVNFHLKGTAIALPGAGADLSLYFTEDVDGDTWQMPWSIGYDEPGGAYSVPLAYILENSQ